MVQKVVPLKIHYQSKLIKKLLGDGKKYKEEGILSDYEVLVVEEINRTKFVYDYRNIARILRGEGS